MSYTSLLKGVPTPDIMTITVKPAPKIQVRQLLPAANVCWDNYSRTPILLPTQSDFAGLLWDDDDL